MDDIAPLDVSLVLRILRGHFGEPDLKARNDPLSELVLTILSQNTNDTNSGQAYDCLRDRFPTWQHVLDADTQAIADAIRIGGLGNIKAERILGILRQLLMERGELSLDFLAEMPLPQAREFLLSLKGVGPKTAACVLLFSLHRPALPVDTHVHRVSLRLGLVPRTASAEKAHVLLERQVPSSDYYPFHLLMIQHGRELCHARRPACARCPLQQVCPSREGIVPD